MPCPETELYHDLTQRGPQNPEVELGRLPFPQHFDMPNVELQPLRAGEGVAAMHLGGAAHPRPSVKAAGLPAGIPADVPQGQRAGPIGFTLLGTSTVQQINRFPFGFNAKR